MLLLRYIRGQKSKHCVVRAVDQNSLREQMRDHGFGSVSRVEIDRQHQPHATHVLDSVTLRLELFEFPEEIVAQFRNMAFQLLKLFQELDGHGTGERAASECRSVE